MGVTYFPLPLAFPKGSLAPPSYDRLDRFIRTRSNSSLWAGGPSLGRFIASGTDESRQDGMGEERVAGLGFFAQRVGRLSGINRRNNPFFRGGSSCGQPSQRPGSHEIQVLSRPVLRQGRATGILHILEGRRPSSGPRTIRQYRGPSDNLLGAVLTQKGGGWYCDVSRLCTAWTVSNFGFSGRIFVGGIMSPRVCAFQTRRNMFASVAFTRCNICAPVSHTTTPKVCIHVRGE